jgi:hypothetical protein
VLLGAFLISHGALGSFIEYYLVFGPGHNEAGALEPSRYVTTEGYVLWGVGIVAVLITVAATAWRIRRRADWQPLDWVAVAAAGFVAFYEEKGLGRFDAIHVRQVFVVALPLILLVVWQAMRAGDVIAIDWPAVRLRSAVVPFANLVAVVLLLIGVIVYFGPLNTVAHGVDENHRLTARPSPASPRLGYASANAVDPKLLADLDTALRAYAGENQPVFDMSNSLGYFYYLLRRDPGTRFVHVAMATSPYAQRLLIADLEKSRPPVVVLDTTADIGSPFWDGIPSTIRHYLVGAYILHGWVPVLRTHGVLLMLRRDLATGALPVLSEPPATTDLWFSGWPCLWGFSPNFLPSAPQGPARTLPVRPVGTRALVQVEGWAAERATGRAASSVVLVSGSRVLATVVPTLPRPDVAAKLGVPPSGPSGFRFTGVVETTERVGAYALAADGRLHPLAGSPTTAAPSVVLPGGRVVATSDAEVGQVERMFATQLAAGRIEVPAGLDLASYDLATISSGGSPLGPSDLVVADEVGPGDRTISASVLPGSAADLRVRVGSCPQWHGYTGERPLYVLQSAGAPVTSVTVSGVRG